MSQEEQAWQIEYTGMDLVIYGPGHLEIVLRHFDPAHVRHEEPLGPEMIGALLQRDWCYLLDDGIELTLISTSDPYDIEAETLHILHIGDTITWQVPETFAETLYTYDEGARP